MDKEVSKLVHPISPIVAKDSEVLILGSFPSVKSREVNFFYGHPQNRFWKVIEAVYGEFPGSTPEEKEKFVRKHQIAMWDVIHSCEIIGSSDQSIRNVVVNDIPGLILDTKVKRIFINGKKAYHLFEKYIGDRVDVPVTCMPSTSPANAAWSLEKLIEAWKEVKIR